MRIRVPIPALAIILATDVANAFHSKSVMPTAKNISRHFASSAAPAAEFELHAPVGKDGEGDYTASTKGCFDVIDAATPAVLQAVDCIPGISTSRPFAVADYGTADAGTSLGLMQKIVQASRNRVGQDLEILIHYEDQKDNEWKSVFNHALGYKTVTDAYGNELQSPVANNEGVFVSACGVGFHDQAFPSGTIDLGVSFTAMHWLSRGPGSLIGQPLLHAAQCEDGEAEAERRQAEQDWLSILKARSNELRPGGRLVIANFCKSKQGYFLGNTDKGANMWESFQKSWDRLADEGLINEEERLGISFPSYYRSSEEIVTGVESVDGLKVVECVERVVRCPYREAWTNGSSNRSAREHAEWYVPTTRTWSESTFKSALQPNRNKDEIMRKFWNNYVDLVEENPEAHGMDYVHTYLVVEKED
jgi:indole-3-acetate O-methyltransferase